MGASNELCDKYALPDGQLVVIEEVHSDGYASVRRIDGQWEGRGAVCAVAKLKRVVSDKTPLTLDNDASRGEF